MTCPCSHQWYASGSTSKPQSALKSCQLRILSQLAMFRMMGCQRCLSGHGSSRACPIPILPYPTCLPEADEGSTSVGYISSSCSTGVTQVHLPAVPGDGWELHNTTLCRDHTSLPSSAVRAAYKPRCMKTPLARATWLAWLTHRGGGGRS